MTYFTYKNYNNMQLLWHCTHVHFKEQVTGQVLKEVVNFDISLDKIKLLVFGLWLMKPLIFFSLTYKFSHMFILLVSMDYVIMASVPTSNMNGIYMHLVQHIRFIALWLPLTFGFNKK